MGVCFSSCPTEIIVEDGTVPVMWENQILGACKMAWLVSAFQLKWWNCLELGIFFFLFHHYAHVNVYLYKISYSPNLEQGLGAFLMVSGEGVGRSCGSLANHGHLSLEAAGWWTHQPLQAVGDFCKPEFWDHTNGDSCSYWNLKKCLILHSEYGHGYGKKAAGLLLKSCCLAQKG